jgi:uncharacterized protein (UPF0332 family)
VLTTREHLDRARQNLACAQSFDLKTTPYLDWVVTAYFYAALHLVDALLIEKENLPGQTHEIRKEYVKSKIYLRAIRDEYRALKDHSEDARYRLITMTSHKILGTIIPLYKAIEKHILQQLPNEKSGK